MTDLLYGLAWTFTYWVGQAVVFLLACTPMAVGWSLCGRRWHPVKCLCIYMLTLLLLGTGVQFVLELYEANMLLLVAPCLAVVMVTYFFFLDPYPRRFRSGLSPGGWNLIRLDVHPMDLFFERDFVRLMSPVARGFGTTLFDSVWVFILVSVPSFVVFQISSEWVEPLFAPLWSASARRVVTLSDLWVRGFGHTTPMGVRIAEFVSLLWVFGGWSLNGDEDRDS